MASDLERLVTSAPSTTLDRFRLDGKVALVVGGNKGLGQAMALALAAAGADVAVAARGPAGLQETADAICGLGRKGMSLSIDATQEDQVQSMVAKYGRDLWSHRLSWSIARGSCTCSRATEFDTETWQRVMDVNIKSLVLCCKHVGRVMLAQGKGKIINISSVRGFQGRIGDLAYAPSKGAVNQLTHSLAIEWGPRGINVNAIAPAFTLTDMSRPSWRTPSHAIGS